MSKAKQQQPKGFLEQELGSDDSGDDDYVPSECKSIILNRKESD